MPLFQCQPPTQTGQGKYQKGSKPGHIAICSPSHSTHDSRASGHQGAMNAAEIMFMWELEGGRGRAQWKLYMYVVWLYMYAEAQNSNDDR